MLRIKLVVYKVYMDNIACAPQVSVPVPVKYL